LPEVDTISGTDMDAKFADAIASGFDIPEKSYFQTP
jgi:hypothetical protein